MRVSIARRREIAEKVRETMGALGQVELDGIPLADLIEPSGADELAEEYGGADALGLALGIVDDVYCRVVDPCASEVPHDDRDILLSAAREIEDALDRRLMPEGMEWPRFEDGEPVRIGDEFADGFGCIDVARPICFDANAYSLDSDAGASSWVGYGERVKRPAVLSADGEPLEVGQTVWDVLGNRRFKVLVFGSDPKLGEFTVKTVGIDGMSLEGYSKPSDLTHQRPVLDAEGVPIKKGDTVWNATTSAGPFTVREIERSDDPDEPEDIVWCGENAANGFKVWRIADQLTHTKPEPPDSWERIEEDATLPPGTYCERRGIMPEYPKHSGKAKCDDLVRRCRALAERGE